MKKDSKRKLKNFRMKLTKKKIEVVAQKIVMMKVMMKRELNLRIEKQ